MGDLAVTIEGDEWHEAVDKAFHKLASKVNIKGFRKGQAPEKILESHITKAERQVQAIDDNLNKWLIQSIQEANVNPISQPTVDIKSFDDDKAELVYTFAVMPEVKLGDYKGLEYKIEETNVSDEEFESELNRMRDTYADMVIKEEPAANGDTVNIDYEGFKDGVPFEGGKGENYNLVLGSGSFIPGFEEQLVGVKAGEEKDLNLTFPEEYHAEELKGQAVVFKVKVNEVKEKVLPELDDDFAKDVNIPEVETVDDLKKKVRERLEENKKRQAENNADRDFLDALSDGAEVEIPDVLIEDEERQMFNQFAANIQQYGMSVDAFLKSSGQTQDEYLKGFEPEATRSVKLRMVLSEIAKKENLEPSEEDVNEELERIANIYQMEVDDVKAAINPEILKEDLKNNMAFKLAKEAAKVVTVKPEK